MHYFSSRMRVALVFVFAILFAASSALAEKPPWAGDKKGGNPKGKEVHEKYDGKGKGDRGESRGREEHRFFTTRQHDSIHAYFADEFRRGNCPPGLAKKRNGCMPPGLAKQWVIGRPLPAGVIYYDLPPQVLVVLGPAPSGHRFVRVAQDILLMAVGTGMIVDAIDNLSWEFNR